MGNLLVKSTCFAEYGVVKGRAVVALGLVAFLYGSQFREKREQRRQQRALAERRRAKGGGLSQH